MHWAQELHEIKIFRMSDSFRVFPNCYFHCVWRGPECHVNIDGERHGDTISISLISSPSVSMSFPKYDPCLLCSVSIHHLLHIVESDFFWSYTGVALNSKIQYYNTDSNSMFSKSAQLIVLCNGVCVVLF